MDIRKEDNTLVLAMQPQDLSEPGATLRVMEDLLHDGAQSFVVDLAAIDSIYSLQIGTLVAIHVLCYENVAVMRLANAGERVRHLLRMVGMDSLMKLHHGSNVALQSVGTGEAAAGQRRARASTRSRKRKPVDPRVKR